MTRPGLPGQMGVSKWLIGRRHGKRVIHWQRVGARGLDVSSAVIVMFLLATCIIGAVNEGHFLETRWGRHLLLLLLASVFLPALAAAGLSLAWGWRIPLDRLPEADADAGSAELKAMEEKDGRLTRRGLVAVLALVVLALLIALLYLEENTRGEHAWNAYQRERQAQGDLLTRAAVVPPPVPDEENFASTPFLSPLFSFVPGTQTPLYSRAFERAKASAPEYEAASARLKSREVMRSNSWFLEELDLCAWATAFVKRASPSPTPDSDNLEFRGRYGPMPSQLMRPVEGFPEAFTNRTEAAAAVLDALTNMIPVLDELRAASRRPYARFNVSYDLKNPSEISLPHYTVLKRVVQVLQLRASAELALGRADEAAEDIQFMLRLVDAIRNEPVILAHLVRVSELTIALQPLAEGLARHQWSDAQLRAFETHLLGFDLLADARLALKGERNLFGCGLIEYVRQCPDRYQAVFLGTIGPGSGQPSQSDVRAALLAAVPSGWFYFERVNLCRVYDSYLLPPIDAAAHRIDLGACRRTENFMDSSSGNGPVARVLRHKVFAMLLLPGLNRVGMRSGLAQTGVDCAAVACALERYRLKHGRFPDLLSALTPESVKQLPNDVINGQPLKYSPTLDGQYVLYSVGWNETDDGGVPGLKADGHHLENTAGDWVWRLPAPQWK